MSDNGVQSQSDKVDLASKSPTDATEDCPTGARGEIILRLCKSFVEKDSKKFDELLDAAVAVMKLAKRESDAHFFGVSKALCDQWRAMCVRYGVTDGSDASEHLAFLCSFVRKIGMLDCMFVVEEAIGAACVSVFRIGKHALLMEALSESNLPKWESYLRSEGVAPLYEAALHGELTEERTLFFCTAHQIFLRMLGADAIRDTVMFDGDSLLYRTVRIGCTPLVRQLCAEGHDPNLWNSKHPVHLLALNQSIKIEDAAQIIQLLVRSGLVMTSVPVVEPRNSTTDRYRNEFMVRTVYLFQVAFAERRQLSIQQALTRLESIRPAECDIPPIFSVYHECHYEQPCVSDDRASWESKSLFNCDGVVVRPTVIVNEELFPAQLQMSILVSVNRYSVPTVLSLYVVPDDRNESVQQSLSKLHAVRVDFRMRDYMSHIRGALEEPKSDVPFFIGTKKMTSGLVDAQSFSMAVLTLRGMERSRIARDVECPNHAGEVLALGAELSKDSSEDKDRRVLMDSNSYLETLSFHKGKKSDDDCFHTNTSIHFDQVSLHASMNLEDYEIPSLDDDVSDNKRPRARLNPEQSMTIQTPVLTVNLTFTHKCLVDAVSAMRMEATPEL